MFYITKNIKVILGLMMEEHELDQTLHPFPDWYLLPSYNLRK